MPWLSLLLVFTAIGTFPLQERGPVPDCATAGECRDLALAADARQDYEAFHDLAWRAVQKGRRNDPDLMLMLARAQSLSGRPLDALVMLGRLVDSGIAPDVATSEDFRRVRALRGWPELEKRIADRAAGASPETAAPALTPDRSEPGPKPTVDAPASPPTAPGSAAARVKDPARASRGRGAETLQFSAASISPSGLAYDAVSRRFIVGDRAGQKLTVVDEFSHQIANLASAQHTGFGDIEALEIDTREGHLWVVSADRQLPSATTLHKLQLISGRALNAFGPPADAANARFVDVAVGSGGEVFVLEAVGRRLFRLRPGGTQLEVVASLGDLAPRSIAPVDGSVYVAHESGLARVELATRTISPVTARGKVDLRGLARVRAHAGTLIAIARVEDGTHRAVRLRLDASGGAVAAVNVLEPSIAASDAAAISIARGALYYLTPGEDGRMAVRRVPLGR